MISQQLFFLYTQTFSILYLPPTKQDAVYISVLLYTGALHVLKTTVQRMFVFALARAHQSKKYVHTNTVMFSSVLR